MRRYYVKRFNSDDSPSRMNKISKSCYLIEHLLEMVHKHSSTPREKKKKKRKKQKKER